MKNNFVINVILLVQLSISYCIAQENVMEETMPTRNSLGHKIWDFLDKEEVRTIGALIIYPPIIYHFATNLNARQFAAIEGGMFMIALAGMNSKKDGMDYYIMMTGLPILILNNLYNLDGASQKTIGTQNILGFATMLSMAHILKKKSHQWRRSNRLNVVPSWSYRNKNIGFKFRYLY